MGRKSVIASLLGAAAGLAMLASSAYAEELQFTVNWGGDDPGVVETFDVNTAVAGTNLFNSADLATFPITNDNLGNTVLALSDGYNLDSFGTGPNAFSAFAGSSNAYGSTTTYGTPQFYDGSSLYLQATPGGPFTASYDGTTISVASAGGGGGPEPSTWALMMVGVFGAGMALRRRQTSALMPA